MPKSKKQIEQEAREFAQGLIKVAMSGHTETCPYCGAKTVSNALHMLSCPKIQEVLDEDAKD